MATNGEDKFESQDLPKILAALHTAKESNQTSKVTVEFGPEGGVVAILVESKKKFK